MREELERKFQEIVTKEAEHLEKFAAAFILEVGSSEASKYMLVRQMNGLEIRWWFELREGEKK